jgi:hypothetical protein
MKTKNWISIIFLIIVIVAIACVLIIHNKKQTDTPIQDVSVITTTEPTAAITIQPEMISVTEDSYLVGIGGSYPKFTQADVMFNKKIAEFVTSGIADFKREANDNYQARLETAGDDFRNEFENGGAYTYEIKTEIIQSNDTYISFLIHINGFSGGAHGYATTSSFNYNVKNKSEITLAQLFPDDQNYLKAISNESRRQLEPKLAQAGEQKTLDENTKSMMLDGTDPKNEMNFQVFTFTKDTVTIYFGQYQVAPYVYGEQSVEISR